MEGNNKIHSLSEREYRLFIMGCFSLGLISILILWLYTTNKPLVIDYYLLLKLWLFLLINHLLLRPLSFSYWASIYSAEANEKPTLIKNYHKLQTLGKIRVLLACLLWLFILVLWIYPVPDFNLKEDIKQVGFVSATTGLLLYALIK